MSLPVEPYICDTCGHEYDKHDAADFVHVPCTVCDCADFIGVPEER